MADDVTPRELMLLVEQNKRHIEKVEDRLEKLMHLMVQVGVGVIGALLIGLGSVCWALLQGL